MMARRFRLEFLNELLAECRRHVAGASAFGAGLATKRQAALNVAPPLANRALCQRWF